METKNSPYRIFIFLLMLSIVTSCEKDNPAQPEEQLKLIVPVGFHTIQAAIDASSHGDTIIVMPGVYFENIDFKGKNVLVQSIVPENTDTIALTIIDGGGNGPVVRFEGGENEDAMLYGFTITNGNAGTNGDGGGIKVSNGSSPTIKSNVIKMNSARYGAGLFVSNNSEPTILMNTITENKATGSRGAGIYVINQSHAIIKDNVFSDHEDVDAVIHIGGANAGHKSSAEITGNIIENNSTTFGAGGIKVAVESWAIIAGNTITNNRGFGDNVAGAISIVHNSVAEIKNNVITGNSANRAGAIIIYRESEATITGNTISENSAGSQDGSHGIGGGIMLTYYGSAVISNNVISNNKAWNGNHGGGGIAIYSWGQQTDAVIENNQIIGNQALRWGGGIYVTGSATTVVIKNNVIDSNKAYPGNQACGGAIYLGSAAKATVVENTISNNYAQWRGGGIYAHRQAVVKNADGAEWPRNNFSPFDEPNNTYMDNSHTDTSEGGENVYFAK